MLFDFEPENNFSKQLGIFGLPYTYENAQLILIPVPWDVTTSYRDGSSLAPLAIKNASYQLDLFDLNWGNAWEKGIFMKELDEEISDVNAIERRKAKNIIDFFENEGNELPERLRKIQAEVNEACDTMNGFVFNQVKNVFNDGKIPALIGGEHSISLAAIRFFTHEYSQFAVLQIDAHADLRKAYMGFIYSHASVMRNVVENSPMLKLVQVGVRDFCEEEYYFIQENHQNITTFFMRNLRFEQMKGKTWDKQVDDIINELPEHVYISFDIDGLDASFCPHTGAPVPGGLTFDEVSYLFTKLVKAGKKIVGFDLVESGVDEENEYDQIISSRLLYQLSLATLVSQS